SRARRGAAGHRDDARHGTDALLVVSERLTFSAVRKVPANRSLHTGGSNDELLQWLRPRADQLADGCEVTLVERIKENESPIPPEIRHSRIAIHGVALEGVHINMPYHPVGKLCEMTTQVAFRHRRDRMPGHGRMTIESVRLVADTRKKIRKNAVAPKRRGRGDQRHPLRRERLQCEIRGNAEISYGRRGIEGTADLVVEKSRRMSGDSTENARQRFAHLLGSHRPAHSRNSEGRHPSVVPRARSQQPERCELVRARWLQEKCRRNPACRQ